MYEYILSSNKCRYLSSTRENIIVSPAFYIATIIYEYVCTTTSTSILVRVLLITHFIHDIQRQLFIVGIIAKEALPRNSSNPKRVAADNKPIKELYINQLKYFKIEFLKIQPGSTKIRGLSRCSQNTNILNELSSSLALVLSTWCRIFREPNRLCALVGLLLI
jgi:hypothetical protein